MSTAPSLLFSGAGFSLSLALWVGFGLALVIFCVFTLVMLWHWKAYSTGAYTTWGSMLTFLLGSTFFLTLMAAAALWSEAL